MSQLVRRWLHVRGQVQGVGFRPFVYRLARELELAGLVRNDGGAVTIEIEGTQQAVEEFERRLSSERPKLAVIDALRSIEIPPKNQGDFVIAASDRGNEAHVTVDTAVCADCLRELFDPADRRFGYGLINCTNCGPRFSIIQRVPYDRPNTTMSQFGLCEICHQQYCEPTDRRFHAQPVACAVCGPRVWLELLPGGRGSCRAGNTEDGSAGASPSQIPIHRAAELLTAGKVLAIKGLGGFHLAVRADDAAAVARLRQLKKRDAKPFALMAANVEAARRIVHLSDAAEKELLSPAAPIVLAPRHETNLIAAEVAPGTDRLGVMLPNTPIQHLLFAAAAGCFDYLVMTSGNACDEPIAIDNEDARARLAGLCDALLLHDRPIERCVDDAVVLDMGDGVLPIRRSRGYAPRAVKLPSAAAEEGLCVGGELKNTVAVVRGDEVILSQHLGDLKHPLAYEHFQKAIDDLCRLFEIRPRWIAHDLHPMYLSTAWAGELARRWDVPLVGVQHHAAHSAAVLAEHGVTGPALAVVCDGTGYGPDGTIWGGELLKIAEGSYERLSHLRPIPLLGGDAAAKETWRCAAGWLATIREKIHQDDLANEMIRRGVGCVQSSSAGRLFDAAASILGLCERNDHEAQAAMALEMAACRGQQNLNSQISNLKFEISDAIDLCGLAIRLVEGQAAGESVEDLALLFHETFAQAWAAAVARAAEQTGLRTVGLSGGVFCNALLTRRLTELLESQGLRVLRHEKVPANDGGIAYGQAAMAVMRGVLCV